MEQVVEAVNMAHSLFGWVVFGIFVVGYFFIAMEERYHINKAKPALFIGTFMFVLIGVYYAVNGYDVTPLHHEMSSLILEIAEIFFFLFVAMTFIETMIERNVFEVLKHKLVSKGYSYKKLFWLTGLLAFFISPVADNLTTALILSTVLFTIDKHKTEFLVAGAINIVVAANAGGAWSPFGDITTLMAWTAKKGEFVDFLFLFPASFIGWFVTAFLLSLYVPKGMPHFDPLTEVIPRIKDGGMVVVYIGISTIVMAVLMHTFMHFPAMWGMMFGLAILKMYSYFHKSKNSANAINVYARMAHIENDTLLFFFGILSAVGALHFMGFLEYVHNLYSLIGITTSNVSVGFISAIIDNVPVMSAVLKASPDMDLAQWMLVTMTAGVGGSLISFGSAAGVGVMGKLRGIYTFGSHMKYALTILVGYIVSMLVWYVQFEKMGLY